MIDATHDPNLNSWVESANVTACDFPIQNLPLGVFAAKGETKPRLGTAIGEAILDIGDWLSGDNLNAFCALPATQRRDLRVTLSQALAAGATKRPLHLQADCRMLMPAAVGDYSDFYSSIHHATNVGSMFRPDNPLLPNYKHIPIGYHGRASSLVVSGTTVKRPTGQLGEGKFGPSNELDYEMEVGALLGPGNTLSEPIGIGDAASHIAGVCLVNDWSARDIQRWEYQPLGPFLAKSFATSVSPWLVTMEALAPFRTAAPPHDVPILPYLQEREPGALDMTVEVWIRSPGMKEPIRLSTAQFRDMFWTLPQMVAHHAVNGCNLRPGDLIASGTVSGPDKENRGCLLEMTWKGTEPVKLPDGSERKFLLDGDEIIMTGFCDKPGFTRIGFGTCRGAVLA